MTARRFLAPEPVTMPRQGEFDAKAQAGRMVEEVASEESRGVETTHYTLTVDLSELVPQEGS